MASTERKDGYWTLPRCMLDAARFMTRNEWRKAPRSGYSPAQHRGWLNECCAHMDVIQRPKEYWTLENCKLDALKYETKKEWAEKSIAGYSATFKRGWLDLCCEHMTELRKPNNYWSLSMCQTDAARFLSKSQWSDNSYGYTAASRKGWVNLCCSHMTPIGNKKLRCIYVYFANQSFYVGLTGNLIKRMKQHYQSPRVKKIIAEFGADNITIRQLTGYVDSEKAAILEGVYYRFFVGAGLTPLNIQKTGNLGGNGKAYTKEMCKIEALKWKYRSAWAKKGKGYNPAVENGWLDECCTHMIELQKPFRYWSASKCKDDALQYDSKAEWRKKSPSAHSAAYKGKWVDECCTHMQPKSKPNGYWKLSSCKIDALLYQSRGEWQKSSPSGYSAAHKNGWLDECCTHMKSRKSKTL